MTDTALPPAGWYQDPAGGPAKRWWDGTAWTQQFEPPAAPVPPTAPQPVAAPQLVAQPQPAPGYVPGGTQFQAQPAAPTAPFGVGPFAAPGLYAPQANGKNQAAVVSLVSGIIACVLLIPPLNRVAIISVIAAIVWGIIGIRRSTGIGAGRKRAIWGLSLGGVALLGSILTLAPLVIDANSVHLDHAGLVKSITDKETSTGTPPSSVDCPTDPPMKAGDKFECAVQFPDGSSTIVEVDVQDDTGYVVWHTK